MITIEHWDYECGDGCCYEQGQRLTVNDILISDEADYMDLEELLTKVLKALNINEQIKRIEE